MSGMFYEIFYNFNYRVVIQNSVTTVQNKLSTFLSLQSAIRLYYSIIIYHIKNYRHEQV